MAPSAGKKLNRSAHTLVDLKRFAKAAPTQAASYLGQVEQRLRDSAALRQADAVKAVLAGDATTLFERVGSHSRALEAIFPKNAKDWAKVQTQRADTVGWEGRVMPAPKEPQFIEGRVAKGKGGWAVVTTSGGRELTLTWSKRTIPYLGIPVALMGGLIHDGPVALQGTLGEDNTSFNVEGFALNADGKFGAFTFGRVNAEVHPFVVSTSRGDVTIEDRALAKRLRALPKLAVILPGAPVRVKRQWVYRGQPEEFFALARFRQGSAHGRGKVRSVLADMAFSAFDNKPLQLPSSQANRVSHPGRVWALGMVQLNPRGRPESFAASYVSKSVESAGLSWAATTQDADALQAAVMTDVQ